MEKKTVKNVKKYKIAQWQDVWWRPRSELANLPPEFESCAGSGILFLFYEDTTCKIILEILFIKTKNLKKL